MMEINVHKNILKIIGFFSLIFFSLDVISQTAGPNLPGAANEVMSIGSVSWTNTSNIVSDDANYSSATIGKNAITYYIVATSYGFAIPLGATITGISVSIDKYSNDTKTYDNVLKLTKNGSAPVGSNYAVTGTNWPASATVSTYGGTTDLWGTTWTPSEINDLSKALV